MSELLWGLLPVIVYFGLSLLSRENETITDTLRAKDAELDPYQLRVLALHRSAEVRLQVALNPSTPSTVLQKLSSDEDARVRRVVAERVHEMVCEWGEDTTVRKTKRRCSRSADIGNKRKNGRMR